MTCKECELLLARGQITQEVQRHVDACSACKALAAELAANAVALHEFRDEPVVSYRLPRSPARRVWKWAVPTAAALVLAALLPTWRAKPHPVEDVPAATTPALSQRPETPSPTQEAAVRSAPLKIKMLTSDPDVVIYWIIDSNERD